MIVRQYGGLFEVSNQEFELRLDIWLYGSDKVKGVIVGGKGLRWGGRQVGGGAMLRKLVVTVVEGCIRYFLERGFVESDGYQVFEFLEWG